MYVLVNNFGYAGGVPGVLGGIGAGYVQPSFMVSDNGILYFGRIKKPSDEKKRRGPKKNKRKINIKKSKRKTPMKKNTKKKTKKIKRS